MDKEQDRSLHFSFRTSRKIDFLGPQVTSGDEWIVVVKLGERPATLFQRVDYCNAGKGSPTLRQKENSSEDENSVVR
ncbi:MAG: hypothetical protein LLG20_07675 [Acidobacteriales bacterium]|nr:hypothetical protein [Terriglobales bacterium]